MSEIKIHFLGAAGTVTGSKYLIEAAGKKILVDCGLFQGIKKLRQLNWENLPVNESEIDCVLITHGHLDHCGFLPRLVDMGYKNRIYGTAPTLEIAEIILRDSAKIQEEDAERANKKGYSKHHPAKALYTVVEVDRTVGHFRAVEEKDPEHMAYSYEDLTGSPLDNSDESSAKISARKLTQTIFSRANCSIFAVVFWFWIGGPLMVIFYRLVCLMAAMAAEGKELSVSFASEVTHLYERLNWFPARATALLYSIAGGSAAYSTWKKYFWSDVSANNTILIESGVNSLPKGNELSPVEENQAALVLIDHALMIFVAVMFVFTLGAWLR